MTEAHTWLKDKQHYTTIVVQQGQDSGMAQQSKPSNDSTMQVSSRTCKPRNCMDTSSTGHIFAHSHYGDVRIFGRTYSMSICNYARSGNKSSSHMVELNQNFRTPLQQFWCKFLPMGAFVEYIVHGCCPSDTLEPFIPMGPKFCLWCINLIGQHWMQHGDHYVRPHSVNVPRQTISLSSGALQANSLECPAAQHKACKTPCLHIDSLSIWNGIIFMCLCSLPAPIFHVLLGSEGEPARFI